MAHKVRKQCISCQHLFVGRRDAKTCSERCRKRLQRARALYQRPLGAGYGLTPGEASLMKTVRAKTAGSSA